MMLCCNPRNKTFSNTFSCSFVTAKAARSGHLPVVQAGRMRMLTLTLEKQDRLTYNLAEDGAMGNWPQGRRDRHKQ